METKEKQQIYFGAKYNFDDQEISIAGFRGRRKQSIRWDEVVNVSTFNRQHMEFLRIAAMDRKFDIGSAAVNGSYAELKEYAEQRLSRNSEKLRNQPAVKFIYPDYVISENRRNYLFHTLLVMLVFAAPFLRDPGKMSNALAYLVIFRDDPRMAGALAKFAGLLIISAIWVMLLAFSRIFIAGAVKSVTYVLTGSVIGIGRGGEGDVRQLSDITEAVATRNLLKIRFRDGTRLVVYDNLAFFRFFREKLEAGSGTKVVAKKSFLWIWPLVFNIMLLIAFVILREYK